MWGGFEDLTKLVTEATSALDDISKGKAIDLDFDKLQEDLDPKLVAEKKADGAARSALAVPSSGSVASAAEPTAPVVVSTPDIVAQANTPDVAALRQELDNSRQTAASEEAQRRALQEMIRVHVDTEVRSAFLFFQAFFVFFCLPAMSRTAGFDCAFTGLNAWGTLYQHSSVVFLLAQTKLTREVETLRLRATEAEDVVTSLETELKQAKESVGATMAKMMTAESAAVARSTKEMDDEMATLRSAHEKAMAEAIGAAQEAAQEAAKNKAEATSLRAAAAAASLASQETEAAQLQR